MKKVLMAEYLEYNSPFKVGNHHYCKMFAEAGYQVLWLSPVYNQLYYFKDKDLYLEKQKVNSTKFVTVEKNILCYSPYSLMLYGNLPLLKSRLANKLSIDLIIPNFKNTLSDNGFDEVDILWLSNPKFYYLTKLIKYKKLIYRCTDDLSGFDIVPESMLYFEKKVIEEADTVFVTSQNLMLKKQNTRSDIKYLPNGVEINNFIRDKYELPIEFQKSTRKKCIYVGAIDHWFDLELIKFCAEKLKDVDFYLVGPGKIDTSILSYISNVYLIGKKNYSEIPNYLYYSNIGIIPFLVNKLTDSIAPIKLYEYMSVGLNVVSTNFKEIKYINSPAYISSNYDEFLSLIIKALDQGNSCKNNNIEFVKNNTWDSRFDKIKMYL